MAAGIEDVARRAGVSVATVSRALRGLPNVAPSTRARVEAAASELHYVAHPHASRLAAKRSATVGLVVPVLSSWYHSQVLAGAEVVLASEGFDLLPYALSSSAARERFVESLPFRKRVDGLIIVDLPFPDDEVDGVASGGVPIVSLGVADPRFPSITVENHAGSRMAVRHLLQLGHTRIGLVHGLDDDPFLFPIPRERRRGYEDALAEAGIEVDPALCVPGNFNLRGGAEAMARLLSLDVPPTAVFALSDEMAIGAMHTARSLGLDVPGDLSIVGFDDNDVAPYVGLTTVNQSVGAQGEVSARLLLGLVDGKAAEDQRLPSRLVLRSTTAPPPDSGRNHTERKGTGALVTSS